MTIIHVVNFYRSSEINMAGCLDSLECCQADEMVVNLSCSHFMELLICGSGNPPQQLGPSVLWGSGRPSDTVEKWGLVYHQHNFSLEGRRKLLVLLEEVQLARLDCFSPASGDRRNTPDDAGVPPSHQYHVP